MVNQFGSGSVLLSGPVYETIWLLLFRKLHELFHCHLIFVVQ